jgi:predicted RNA-binding protein with PIN domain
MKRYRFLFLLLAALSMTSCLDEHPKDQLDEDAIYGSASDIYINAVASLYNYIGGANESEGIQGTCRGIYDYNTLTTDEAMIPIRGGDWYDGGLWNAMYQHRWSADDQSLYDTWKYLYKVIVLANKSLDIISNKSALLSAAQQEEYRAEIRAIRAMSDIEKMHGKFEGPYQEGEAQVLRGIAPVACMANYQKEVTVYKKGLGKVTFRFAGYYPCHNTEEVVAQTGYDPERDLSHPADSVFCAHGAGFIVPWNEVPDHMHVEGRLLKKKEQQEEAPSGKKTKTYDPDHWIDIEEIDAILARTYHANKHEKGATKQWRTTKKVISGDNAPRYAPVKAVSKEEYLLVDGYNIIFAWESLKELAAVNIDGARGKLLDILCNYQGIKKCNLIVVFDAYRVKGHQTEMFDHHNIHVVYTKEAETADAYIEKFAHENGRKYHVTVATSDGLEQIIITGQGCHLLSAREFEREVEAANQTLRETIDGMREKSSNHILGDALKQLTDEKIQL